MMISSSSSKPTTTSAITRRRFRAPFLGGALALLVPGCAERYEIGVISRELDQSAVTSSDLVAALIVDGVEDADAVIEGPPAGRGVGDIDGDGYDDWLSGGTVVRFGGPRPTDGVLRAPPGEGPDLRGPGSRFEGAGDVDGDGHADIIVSSYEDIYHSYAFETGEYALEVAESRAQVFAAWREQRAFLWYGGPDRSAREISLPELGIAFGDRDALQGRFQAELGEPLDPADSGYNASHEVALTALGDIDGDGYGDLALKSRFGWSAFQEVQTAPDAVSQVTTRERAESVTYIYYGRAERFALDAAVAQPDARLDGVSSMQRVGDVNGDGFEDVHAMGADGMYLIPGGASRLTGEVRPRDIGVRMQGNPVRPAQRLGDVDGDGIDDFITLWSINEEGAFFYLVYGSPALLSGPVDQSMASAVIEVPGVLGEVVNLGDSDGDGKNDLGLWQALWAEENAPFTAPLDAFETRRILGSATRFEGRYGVPMTRPGLESREPISAPLVVGDIDADGMDDFMFRGGPQLPRTWYVKYGSAATPVIY